MTNIPVTLNLSSFSTIGSTHNLAVDSANDAPHVNYLYGNFEDFKDSTAEIIMLKSCVSGDGVDWNLHYLPATCRFISNIGSNISEKTKCVWTTSLKQANQIISTEGLEMKSGTADFIKDMSALELVSSSYSWMKRIQLTSLDLTSTAASADSVFQTALSTLSGKGVTISITYATSANTLASTLAAKKYAIVYKGNDLLVEPTDTSAATISAAYDAVYTEFDSLEEANAFISENNLAKVVSEMI